MKYYLHDVNSFNDEKITQLYMNFGYEGLGLFYTLLEKIAIQEKPVQTNVLKHQLHVGKKLERCWNFLEEIGLICSSNGETFNEQLLNFSRKYQVKKEKNKKRIQEWRENQSLTENVTRYEPVSNARKVNRSKVNNDYVIKEEDVGNAVPVFSQSDTTDIDRNYYDAFWKELKIDEQNNEAMQRMHRINPAQLRHQYGKFFSLQMAKRRTWPSYPEFRDHLHSWMIRQGDLIREPAPANVVDLTEAKRRMQDDYAAGMTEANRRGFVQNDQEVANG